VVIFIEAQRRKEDAGTPFQNSSPLPLAEQARRAYSSRAHSCASHPALRSCADLSSAQHPTARQQLVDCVQGWAGVEAQRPLRRAFASSLSHTLSASLALLSLARSLLSLCSLSLSLAAALPRQGLTPPASGSSRNMFSRALLLTPPPPSSPLLPLPPSPPPPSPPPSPPPPLFRPCARLACSPPILPRLSAVGCVAAVPAG